ncbi:uncharacterized protein LOC142887705 isoform X5 [Nelusetta ayraudi]|uniref:uncharacterized protein LOC142887705 isoform X5 n=1 Tax=Nelusetta ayraudi TaxID=303726 RepID=UPI003F7304CD
MDSCVCDCGRSETARTVEEDEEEKKKLKLEAKQLRRSLRRQRRQVALVCDEVECVEKTLLKRRAELRQADRLLLEAWSCISSTRQKASSAQQQADLSQHTAERSATCLTEAVRDLQEEAEQLRRRRQEEELMLREVEEALNDRRRDLARVNTDLDSATHRLSAALSDCQDARNRLDSLCKQELGKQQGALLSQHCAAACDLEEDERKLASVRSELQANRAELKQVLLELLREQQMLEEATEKRCQGVQRLRRKQHRAEAELLATQGQVRAKWAELEKLREEVEGKRSELEELQQEAESGWRKAELHLKEVESGRKEAELRLMEAESGRKEAELHLMEAESGRKEVELHLVEAESGRKEAELRLMEVESGRKEAELCLVEVEQLKTDLQHQQEELSRRREERSSVEEQCKHLEARRRHAHRCLSAVETELRKQREELDQEAAASQEQLQENSELLSLLSERLEEKKKELQSQEQELSAISQQRAEQLQDLDAQIQQKQAQCAEWTSIQSAARQLEDRGRCLEQQELQLNELSELTPASAPTRQTVNCRWVACCDWSAGEELLPQGEEQRQRLGEELILKEAWLGEMKEELHKMEDEPHQRIEETSREGAESFYLATAGRRSVLSTEDDRWEVELQREKLRQQEDHLKARLRCSLWSREETLEERRLEAQETLEGLRHRVDQLDSLLASPEPVT